MTDEEHLYLIIRESVWDGLGAHRYSTQSLAAGSFSANSCSSDITG